jgi:hypothetical protein
MHCVRVRVRAFVCPFNNLIHNLQAVRFLIKQKETSRKLFPGSVVLTSFRPRGLIAVCLRQCLPELPIFGWN